MASVRESVPTNPVPDNLVAPANLASVKLVPAISFIGKSDSGKTTFLEKLIAELAGTGLRVATVKNHSHNLEVDVVGKDSWRHAQAGAVVSMVASPSQYAVIHKTKDHPTVEMMIEEATRAGCDILITEGFKKGSADKIELSRRARSDRPVCSPDELVALVTDNTELAAEYGAASLVTFDLDDVSGVARFVRSRYLGDM